VPQTEQTVALAPVWYCPPAQALQAVSPVVLVKAPARQVMQAEDELAAVAVP
jgi:hypothetical protein